MAVVFDPHENIPGNKISAQAVTVTGTKYRMLVPVSGPFYSHSLVVKSGTTTLKLGNDYLITHPYLTATSRTGRSVHGMIWVVNPAFTSNFTLSYNAVGKGAATTAQITAERLANANKFPTDCQWEQVIGEVYFPPVDIQFDWATWKGERELMQAIADIGAKLANTGSGTETNDQMVLSLLTKYHALVDSLYRTSPAIPHVARKDNPHGDQSYGRMRAIELNGIADDSTLAFGRTQAQLADYINQRSAATADFSDKMLRKNASPRTITGTFTMIGGLSAITSSKDKESNGVGSTIQVDDKVVRFLSRDSTTINVGNNPVTFKGGANQLILYPDTRGLQWNGKVLLDPTTVGPYLPGNTGGGSGVFFATSTIQVTGTGSGIQSMPFNFTYVPPDGTDVSSLALRQLTNDFGTSESLAATPALIQKLANAFTGKLEAAKAYINGLSLMTSVTLDRASFNLDNVVNTADVNMPVSDLQRTEFAKYAKTDHEHTLAQLGITDATTAKTGLVQYGGLVDNAGLALDGQYVVQQFTDVTSLEQRVGKSDAESLIDIIRFGGSGNGGVTNPGTKNGWMATINSNNYFVGNDYTVPLATFNVAELFPQSYQDTVIGVFVDIVNNAAVYLLKDNPDFAENDTLTRIGEIYTSETGIDELAIRNTTRLGDFRELDDHENDASAHTLRTMTQAQFGYTFSNAGPVWNNGFPNTARGDGDYRMLFQDNYTTMDNVDWKDTNTMLFRKTGLSAGSHRYVLHQAPLASLTGGSVTWMPDTPTSGAVTETVLCAFKDKDGVRNRISLLVQRTNNITGSDGKLCYVGLALNYQTNRESIIGFTPASFITAATWDTLAPVVNFAMTRSAGAFTMTGEVRMGPFNLTFTLTLAGTPSVTVTRTDTSATQTVSLANWVSTYKLDLTDVVANPNWDVFTGMGGKFDADTTATVNLSGMKVIAHYDTALDYLNNLSELNRVRVIKGFSPSFYLTDVRSAVAQRALFEGARNPGGVPDYVNTDRVIALSGGSNFTAVIVRD